MSSVCSARVMRNENGESRGFGFVSYQTPDQGKSPHPPLLTTYDQHAIVNSKCSHARYERCRPGIQTVGRPSTRTETATARETSSAVRA